MDSETRSQRFVALCILGLLLFNFPILALFNVADWFLGAPVLYVYLFGAWVAFIVLLALVAESKP